MERPLDKVLQHLRTIRVSGDRASKTRDFAELRKAIGDYHKVSPETSEAAGDIAPANADGVRVEWVTAPESESGRRLLYIHGGSWIGGSIEGYRPLASRIATASRCAVLLVEYGFAPEHPFPAGLEDCLTAYRWMRDHGPDGRAACDRAFIAGDSAGGNLALATLLALRDRGEPLPDAAVAISPATDLTGTGESTVTRAAADPIIDGARVPSTARVYAPGFELTEPLLSPLFGALDGLPPLLIQVGDAETLLDDSVRFAKKAKAAGVDATLEVWPEMPHAWHVFAGFLPEAEEAIDRIGAFFNRF